MDDNGDQVGFFSTYDILFVPVLFCGEYGLAVVHEPVVFYGEEIVCPFLWCFFFGE